MILLVPSLANFCDGGLFYEDSSGAKKKERSRLGVSEERLVFGLQSIGMTMKTCQKKNDTTSFVRTSSIQQASELYKATTSWA